MCHKLGFLAVIFLSGLSFIGCSIKENLDDMHDKTSQMAATTQGMASDSDALKSWGLATYAGLREINGKKDRDDSRNCIINSDSLSDKLGCSLAYMYGFDFQYWKNQDTDDQPELEKMKKLAAEEFFQFLTLFYGPNSKFLDDYRPLNPNTLNLYAFSATLHEISPDQDTQAKLRSFKQLSMLQIIQDGLLNDYLHPAHDPDKITETSNYWVGVFRDDAINLLKMRVTFMPILAYAFFNKLQKEHSYQIVLNSWRNAPWTIDPNKWSVDQFDFYTKTIRRALMTRQFLNQINIDATPDDSMTASANVHKLYRNLEIKFDRTNRAPEFVQKTAQALRFDSLSKLLWAPREKFLKVDPANYVITN